jgi:glycosyltransferase involved in cell wall biosynthesis
MKVAIIHYWLVGMRGGEKVLEQLCLMYPDADIYTHVIDRDRISDTILRHKVETTFIAKLPRATRYYQKYLPLMPIALEQLDMSQYDLIISSEAGPAKGIVPMPDAVHVCYCHSPMRYIWNMYQSYNATLGRVGKAVFGTAAHYLRLWDTVTAGRVDSFVANSANVARRIDRYYGRQAEVVFPPVDIARFRPTPEHEDFYLVAGQLVGYKRVDLAIQAFNRLGKRLIVAGRGERYDDLAKIAGPTVTMLGRVSDADLDSLYSRCRALVFPGEEDFGIIPLEAQASGKPVIAYGRGGALETILGDATGLFFPEQTVESLIDAVERFESRGVLLSPFEIAAHAARFDTPVFRTHMARAIDSAVAARNGDPGRQSAASAATPLPGAVPQAPPGTAAGTAKETVPDTAGAAVPVLAAGRS